MTGIEAPAIDEPGTGLAQEARLAASGLAAGAAATLAMSGVMLAAGRLGLMGEYPPERIARAGLVRAGHGPLSAEQLDGVVGSALHLAFGAAIGAAFAASVPPLIDRIRRRAPAVRSVRPELVLPAAGLATGSAVWLVSYAGWLPALGLLPAPPNDRPDRQLAMLVAHWVFGAALGASLTWLGRSEPMIREDRSS